MGRSSLATALLLYAVLLTVTVKECIFLAPLRWSIWDHYRTPFLVFSFLFLFNSFAAVYAVLRKLALKDTGDKLSHLEKQLRGRETISEELTGRITQRK